MILIFHLSILKMFPADKKRVEAALAAANLPKGKVCVFMLCLYMSVFIQYLTISRLVLLVWHR